MCWVCKIKQIVKNVGEVQTENKDEAIEDQARRGIWAWSKRTSSQPVFLYSAACRHCPWLPAGSSPEDELWSGSEEDSIYQSIRWQMVYERGWDGPGWLGWWNRFEVWNAGDMDLAWGWRGQDKAFCLGVFWWGGSYFSRKPWFLLLRRDLHHRSCT